MNTPLTTMTKRTLSHYVTLIWFASSALSSEGGRLSPADLIAEVESGKRDTAHADWWGFNETDATGAIQQAVDSGAKKVVIPFVGQPWIIRPVKLRGDLELFFEPGVLVLAKQGEFQGGGDSLFAVQDKSNVVIRGYGAVLRMMKADYQQPPYEKAEWRMGLRVMGCQNITIEGLRIESSGGDGIYIGSSGKNRWCDDITIRDCVCFDNHRQGMSVISAQNLLIENCKFIGTSGTPPEAGIDFEADSEDERFVNCVVRNCTFESNAGHAILIYLKPMTSNSEPVSIRVENCHSRMGTPGITPSDFENRETSGWSGMSVGAIGDDGPDGLIEFIDCTTQNTGKEGVKVFDKSADRARVRFVRCKWSNPWVSRHRSDSTPRVPVLIQLRRPEITKRPGGIEFIDCHVFDDRFAPVVEYTQNDSHLGLFDVTGNITVHSPHQPRLKLGPDGTNVDLKITSAANE